MHYSLCCALIFALPEFCSAFLQSYSSNISSSHFLYFQSIFGVISIILVPNCELYKKISDFIYSFLIHASLISLDFWGVSLVNSSILNWQWDIAPGGIGEMLGEIPRQEWGSEFVSSEHTKPGLGACVHPISSPNGFMGRWEEVKEYAIHRSWGTSQPGICSDIWQRLCHKTRCKVKPSVGVALWPPYSFQTLPSYKFWFRFLFLPQLCCD